MRTRIYFHFLLFAYASLFLLGMSDNLRGPIYSDILKTFAVDPVRGSMFFSVTSICAFAGGFMTAKLIRRFSHYLILQASILLCALSLVVMAMAPGFWWLMLGCVLLGVSYGWMGVVQNILVARFAPHQHKQQWMTGLHTVYAGSALLAPSLVAFLYKFMNDQQALAGSSGLVLGLSFSVWRMSLLCGSGVGLLIFVVAFAVFHRSQDLLVLEHISQPKNSVKDQHSKQTSAPSSQWPRHLFAISLAMYVVGEIIVSSRLASFAEQVWHASAAQASLWTTGFFVCMFASRFYFSLRPSKMLLPNFLLLNLSLSIVCVLIGILVHPAALLISGLMMGPFYPNMMVWAERNFHSQLEDCMAAAIAFSSFFLVFSQTAYGYLLEAFGPALGYWLAPLALIVSAALLLTLSRHLSISQKDLVA